MKSISWANDLARRVLAETLFYDEEYGVTGSLSLIDETTAKERFIASFLPEESTYIIEQAIQWDAEDEGDGLGYAIATEATTHGTYDTADAAAAMLLSLAHSQELVPSLVLLFEEAS